MSSARSQRGTRVLGGRAADHREGAGAPALGDLHLGSAPEHSRTRRDAGRSVGVLPEGRGRRPLVAGGGPIPGRRDPAIRLGPRTALDGIPRGR